MRTRKTKASKKTKLLYVLVRYGCLIGWLAMIFIYLVEFTLINHALDAPDWVHYTLIAGGPILLFAFWSFQDDPFWAKKLPRNKYGRYISPFLDDDGRQFDERGE